MPAPDRAMFAYPNYVDQQLSPSSWGSFLTPTFSGGSWNASYPLTNLALPDLYRKTRSTDLALSSTKFIVDMKANRSIMCAALVRHNLHTGAKVRVLGGNTSGASDVYNSGWLDVFSAALYEPGSMPWGFPSMWTGKATPEDLAHYASLTWVHTFDSLKTARYWTIEIDSSSTLNGVSYVELGRAFLAPAFIPNVNVAYGAEIGWQSTTEWERSRGGSKVYNPGFQFREFGGRIQALSQAQGLQFVHDMYGRLGLDDQLIFAMNPNDTYHLHRRAFLATLKELNPLRFAYFNLTEALVALEEVL